MDSHNYTPHIYTQAHSASRVYINPNFQRNNAQMLQNNSVHINPLFPQHANIQPAPVNKAKIYVNPNFVKTNITVPSTSHYPTVMSQNSYYPAYTENNIATSSAYAHVSENTNSYFANINSQYSAPMATLCGSSYSMQNIYVTSSNYAATSQLSLPCTTPIMVSNKIATQPILASSPVTKSRYAIVRQNNTVKAFEASRDDKVVTKLKINKYKTVTLDQAKRSMQTDKATQKVRPKLIFPHTSTPVLVERNKRLLSPRIVQSRFKLVKKISSAPTTLEIKTPVRRRQSLNTSKIIVRTKNTTSKIMNKKKFKLNNIPCPLFMKFGNCLRADKGTCDLLHDKKHVSICRKFLKGACHDKECLLSHELTHKKMPTCYFYLKGMCTKEDCPYLHVKLNDKAKVCTDFLKGYCEKGDKCLNRHINNALCPELTSKGSCSRRQCPYSHGSNKKLKVINKNRGKAKTPNQSFRSKQDKRKINKKKNEEFGEVRPPDQQDNSEQKDCRYYKEVVEDESDLGLETIKPTRCKLGELPSFIGL